MNSSNERQQHVRRRNEKTDLEIGAGENFSNIENYWNFY